VVRKSESGLSADIARTARGIALERRCLAENAPFSLPWRPARSSLSACPGGRAPLMAVLRLSSIIRLEATMRVIFSLPPLLVAGTALGGLFAPLAVGNGPTDS